MYGGFLEDEKGSDLERWGRGFYVEGLVDVKVLSGEEGLKVD